MKREVVVFDLGGVLFRWQPADLLQQVFPTRARDAASAHALGAQIFQTFDVDSDWAQFDLGQIEPQALAQRIARRTGIGADELMALIAAIPPHMAVKTDTVALLRELREHGHRLVYLSNMPAAYADWIESDHDFFAWFEDGVFSARVRQMKPDPAIYATAIERLGLAGQSPVFIDDMQRNIDAAHAQGWRGVHFESAAQAGNELARLGLLPQQR